MNKKEVKELYLKKIKDFKFHNYLYFEKNNPKLSDGEFDKLKNEIFDLEKKHKYLKNEDSPSNSLGFKPSKNFKKVPHKVPMLSLSNAFTKEDLLNFEKRIANTLCRKLKVFSVISSVILTTFSYVLHRKNIMIVYIRI